MDSHGKKAGKGALIQEELSATLGVSNDQYLFQPITFEPGIASREGGHIYEGVSGTLRAKPGDNQMAVAYGIDRYNQAVMEGIAPTLKTPNGGDNIHCVMVENHPHDSRCNIDDSGTCQTLTSRMGTGGNNVPMVMMPIHYAKSRRAKSKDDFETWKQTDTTNTLNTFDQGDVRATDLVLCMATAQSNAEIGENICPTITAAAGMSGNNQPIVCLEGNGARPSHRGDGWAESDVMFTLNTVDRHAVCYPKGVISCEVFHCNCEEELIPPLKARDYKDPLVICIDRVAFNQGENAKYQFQIGEDGIAQTLVARGPGAVCYKASESEDGNDRTE